MGEHEHLVGALEVRLGSRKNARDAVDAVLRVPSIRHRTAVLVDQSMPSTDRSGASLPGVR